jgi:hypothetical protein
LRVVIADDFEAAICVTPVKNPDNREVKSPELPPCLGAMAILDLGDNAEGVYVIEEQPIRLTPTSPGSILELDPRPGDVFRTGLADCAISEVSLRLPFICDSAGFSPTSSPSSNKRWLPREYLRPANILRGDKAPRRG